MKDNTRIGMRQGLPLSNDDGGLFLDEGFDSFGPFKLVGGIQKGHPTDAEIKSAVEFYNSIV